MMNVFEILTYFPPPDDFNIALQPSILTSPSHCSTPAHPEAHTETLSTHQEVVLAEAPPQDMAGQHRRKRRQHDHPLQQ
jgi:hypothetical protein